MFCLSVCLISSLSLEEEGAESLADRRGEASSRHTERQTARRGTVIPKCKTSKASEHPKHRIRIRTFKGP